MTITLRQLKEIVNSVPDEMLEVEVWFKTEFGLYGSAEDAYLEDDQFTIEGIQ